MRDSLPPLNRRDALKLLSLGAGAYILAACGDIEETAPPAGVQPPTRTPSAAVTEISHTAGSSPTPEIDPTALPDIPGLNRPPEDFEAGRLTPTEDFYEQNSNGTAVVDEFAWRLSLNGLFDTPAQLSLADLKRYPPVEVMRTLECIGNPVGGTLIGNAIWRGVSLAAVLADAGLAADAQYLLFLSEDEYETSIPVALATDPRSLLVYEMNGEALPVAHGFPLRALLPGVYGQKQPKWLTSMRASATDKLGTWEKKGWSNEAGIQVNSRIETPRLRQTLPQGVPFHLTGIAFAGMSGIAAVEVSVDDGASWHAAELLPGPDAGVWTLWNWRWENPLPGRYVVAARATDGNGSAQTASGAFGVLDNVFPNGTSLMHNLSITVA
jgi:DMSO/TMAO reductase YedYZ molybdopterin-dependent catalytic subunit